MNENFALTLPFLWNTHSNDLKYTSPTEKHFDNSLRQKVYTVGRTCTDSFRVRPAWKKQTWCKLASFVHLFPIFSRCVSARLACGHITGASMLKCTSRLLHWHQGGLLCHVANFFGEILCANFLPKSTLTKVLFHAEVSPKLVQPCQPLKHYAHYACMIWCAATYCLALIVRVGAPRLSSAERL